MAQTFEELTASELDALYQGALFLSGGISTEAERLLVEAVTLAFREHIPESAAEESRRWLESRLARAFLRNLRDGPTVLPSATADRTSLNQGTFDGLTAEVLHDAASLIPPRPSAAIWLALLRRWGHAEAARIIDVDVGDMTVLLGYRDSLLQELLGGRGSTLSRVEVQ